jgi:DNA polymerase
MLDRQKQLVDLYQETLECTRCRDLIDSRNLVVFGTGALNADVVIIGEAPGYHENRTGVPFVGKAGELLDKMLGAIGLSRNTVYILNALKCRPDQNRNPTEQEIRNCSQFLHRQLSILSPKCILCMGRYAIKSLFQKDGNVAIKDYRAQLLSYELPTHYYGGQPISKKRHKVVCSYHPAYLLRNPDGKKRAWEDLKLLKQNLEATE